MDRLNTKIFFKRMIAMALLFCFFSGSSLNAASFTFAGSLATQPISKPLINDRIKETGIVEAYLRALAVSVSDLNTLDHVRVNIPNGGETVLLELSAEHLPPGIRLTGATGRDHIISCSIDGRLRHAYISLPNT